MNLLKAFQDTDGATWSAADNISTKPDGKTLYPLLFLADNADNSTWIGKHNGEVWNVTLTRTLLTGGWNTFAVPFAIANPANVFGAGVKVKELKAASVSDNTLTLIFDDASSIEAGKPYLVKVTAAVENPTFNGVTISNSTTPTTFSGVVSFVPVINPTAMTAGDKTKLFVTVATS